MLISVGVMIGFQNCGTPRGGGMLGSTALKAPFAYDISVDHMAYMSCSGQQGGSLDPSAYFTYRVGAYGENSGIRIHPDFLEYTEHLDKDDQARLLRESPMNQGAIPQLAVRSASSVQNILLGSGASPRPNLDHQTLLGDLTHPTFLIGMLNGRVPGEWIRYIPGIKGLWGKRVEASVSYYDSESLADYVRQQTMNNGALLALTYKSTLKGTGELARTPAEFHLDPREEDFQYVFGKALRMTYKQHGASSSTKPMRVLASVETLNLIDRSVDSREIWSCPTGLAYRIVRDKDSAEHCPKIPDPANPDANIQALRRLLPVEDWWLNTIKGCVVSKKGGDCYDPGIITITYDSNADCGGSGQPHCSHFVSMCRR
jgi:hypothetical protein